jgi:hypothetical protein
VATEEKSLRDDEFKRWQENQRFTNDGLKSERDHEERLAEIRARGTGSGGSDSPKLTPRQESEAKIFSGNVTAAEKALAEARSALSGATNSIKRKAAEAALAEATAAVAEANRKYSDFWDRVEGKRSTPDPKTPENKPAPANRPPLSSFIKK